MTSKEKEIKNVIENSERVVLIHHIDADGICSAALWCLWLKNNKNIFPFIFSPKYGEIREHLVNAILSVRPDCILILDIPRDNVDDLEEIIKILVDHHRIPKSEKKLISFVDLNKCTTTLSFDLLSSWDEKFEKYAWIAAIGSLGDKDYENYNRFKEITARYYDIKEEDFKKMMCIISSSRIFNEKGAKVAINSLVEAACIDMPSAIFGKTQNSRMLLRYWKVGQKLINIYIKQSGKMEKYEDKKVIFYELESKYGIQNYVASVLARQFQDYFIFVINKGFHWKYAYLEARTRREDKDLGKLLEDITKRLEEGKGGGHKNAAGARFVKEDLSKFKELVLSSI